MEAYYTLEATVLKMWIILARISLETPKRVLANSADPDQTPQNAASARGPYCLQIVFFLPEYLNSMVQKEQLLVTVTSMCTK